VTPTQLQLSVVAVMALLLHMSTWMMTTIARLPSTCQQQQRAQQWQAPSWSQQLLQQQQAGSRSSSSVQCGLRAKCASQRTVTTSLATGQQSCRMTACCQTWSQPQMTLMQQAALETTMRIMTTKV
jgi:hypothetical protein